MRKEKSIVAICTFAIWAVSCTPQASFPAVTSTPVTPTATIYRYVNPNPYLTSTRTSTPWPTEARLPTWTPGSSRTPAPMPDLHTAGPYIYVNNPYLYPEKSDGFLYDVDGSGQREVVAPEAFYGWFSPDMRWYAFLTAEEDEDGVLLEKGITLWAQNMLDGSRRKIGDLLPKDYAQRQQRMLDRFIQEELSAGEYDAEYWRGAAEAWLRSMDRIVAGTARIFTWSPDSRYLAFSAMVGGDSFDVYLWDADTGLVQRKDYEYLNVYDIVWSPDSQWLLFQNVEPTMAAPSVKTTYWAVRVDSSQRGVDLDYFCHQFYWMSETEFYGNTCPYGCGGDPPSGTDLFSVDLETGAKQMIWKGDWYGFAVDKENGTIILSAIDPCKGENCFLNTEGIYLGPIFGEKHRIADAPEYFHGFRFRGGTAHTFLGFPDYDDHPFHYLEGVTPEGKTDWLIGGNHLRIFLSPDYRWLAVSSFEGLTLFDESDAIVFQWAQQPVFDAVWDTRSRTLYYLVDDAVWALPVDSLQPHRVFECYPGICNNGSQLLLLPGLYLAALPALRAQPSPSDSPSQGTSLWTKAVFRDLTEPGISKYYVSIPRGTSWRWDFSWCAKTQDGLAEILAPLDIEFLIGGEPIGEDIFRIYDSVKGSGYCRTWATLLSGWQPGYAADLEIRYSLSEAVNDGTRTYPAGEYRQIMHITVS